MLAFQSMCKIYTLAGLNSRFVVKHRYHQIVYPSGCHNGQIEPAPFNNSMLNATTSISCPKCEACCVEQQDPLINQ